MYTIRDAEKSVSVSVMDFGPVSLYGRASDPGQSLPTDTPVWWPSLFDAVLSAVLTRRVYVRLLVSKWAHTSDLIEPFLRALQAAADAGRADKFMTAGQLEIKEFIIPGWDSTTGSFRKYPGHSRVNHTKYIVTDRRVNIGTSNMTWDYFVSTAGSSVNTDHPGLVRYSSGRVRPRLGFPLRVPSDLGVRRRGRPDGREAAALVRPCAARPTRAVASRRPTASPPHS